MNAGVQPVQPAEINESYIGNSVRPGVADPVRQDEYQQPPLNSL